MTTICACCSRTIRYPDTEVESQLYSRATIILCEPCGDAEEVAVEEEGCNDIPALLATYIYR